MACHGRARGGNGVSADSLNSNGGSLDAERLVRELQRGEAYGRPGLEVGFLQTHISRLFFAGERVYKIKKPVELGFLDFSTLELRRQVCEEEVRLNRRLAPQVYLGVVPVTEAGDGTLRVGGEGPALEWAVEMVRLPEHGMLSNLLDRGEIDNEPMNALAELLARFHAEAPTGEGVDEHGSVRAVTFNVEENFAQLEPFVDAAASGAGPPVNVISRRQHDFLAERARTFLEQRGALFEARLQAGRIREGHGDLHAGNVCFAEEGVVAYDCIEFNRRFRCADVACDLAFLTMDLDRRGYPGFSKYLERRYAAAAEDEELTELSGFYKQYRAVVRAKVAAMTASDPAVQQEAREELRRGARSYVQLAVGYDLPPALILMCGLPASGKSWSAQALAQVLRAPVLHSDVRRKVLGGIARTTRVQDGYGAGLYSQAAKQRTYDSLLEDAMERLGAGHTVILDATFSTRAFREPFAQAARREGFPLLVAHVSARDELVRERLEARAKDPHAVSDANLEVYLKARASFEPPDELPARNVARLTSGEGAHEDQLSVLVDQLVALDTDTESHT